jgi:hypothetical protein
MNLANETRHQHFVSQVEQRLNASVGNKIYEFTVERRGEVTSLSPPVPKHIQKNLQELDLFSFNVESKARLRENFERLFQQYEDSLNTLTLNLLDKVNSGIQVTVDDLERLFAAKLMGFARNPYSVEKMLKTFEPFLHVHPMDAELRSLHAKVILGTRPHQLHLCSQIGISKVMYRDWLTVLFMLLIKLPNENSNFLNMLVKRGLSNSDSISMVAICTYSSECVLLSDRAGTLASIGDAEVYEFNLSKSAFVSFVFVKKDVFMRNTPAAYFGQFGEQRIPVNIVVERDNLEQLKAFNSRVVSHSYKRVFCASKVPLHN